jgi:hypothetical protein
MAGVGVFESLDWCKVRSFLPLDLTSFVKRSGALERFRNVPDADAYIRTLLLYGMPKSTLESSAQIAREANLADLTPEALFKRLKKAPGMLEGLFFHLLTHAVEPAERFGSYRLLAVDATVLTGPNAKGVDQKLHVVYDLGKGLPVWVEVTHAKDGGETLARHHSFGAGDLVLGDRGYGHERGLMSALKSKANFLVRFEFESIKLFNDLEERIDPLQADGCIPQTGPADFCVYLADWVAPLRAIGERKPDGKVVWLLTNLGEEELPIEQARKLYARRWQIELFFKRLKSLVDLDELPTRDGPMARPWIWAKLTLAALAVLIDHERFSPWGTPFQVEDTQKVSPSTHRGIANGKTQTKKRTPKRKTKGEVRV